MSDKILKEIEKTFQLSNDSNELFDALRAALSNRVDNPEIYKILLANPALSKDELVMFTEKIADEFTNCKYEIYNWAAKIFENNFEDYSFLEKAIYYYQKAAVSKPYDFNPLLSVLKLYSYELPLPSNEDIMKIVNIGVEHVKQKAEIYYAMAEHFKKVGNLKLARKYKSIAEKESQDENQ
jgi:RNAse (barnase) inhibitor barstar